MTAPTSTQLNVATVIRGRDNGEIEAALVAGGIDVTARAHGVEELAAADVAHVDAIVVGLDGEGLALDEIALVRRRLPSTAIVAVVGTLDRRRFRDVLGAGIDGIVLEPQIEHCLALAVRAARSGQLVLPGELRPQLAKPRLSPRERQILALVVIGFTNGEIAQKLFVTEATVKSHLSSAFAKLGVRSRTEASDLILDPESGLGTGILAISDGEAPSWPVSTSAGEQRR